LRQTVQLDAVRTIFVETWILDHYQVSADKPEYITHLFQRVITVSVETVKIVNALPRWMSRQ
jgi:predicted helicase